MSNVEIISQRTKFCVACGNVLLEAAKICPKCGVEQANNRAMPNRNRIPIQIIENQKTKFCVACGNVLLEAAKICPKCGVEQYSNATTTKKVKPEIPNIIERVKSFWFGLTKKQQRTILITSLSVIVCLSLILIIRPILDERRQERLNQNWIASLNDNVFTDKNQNYFLHFDRRGDIYVEFTDIQKYISSDSINVNEISSAAVSFAEDMGYNDNYAIIETFVAFLAEKLGSSLNSFSRIFQLEFVTSPKENVAIYRYSFLEIIVLYVGFSIDEYTLYVHGIKFRSIATSLASMAIGNYRIVTTAKDINWDFEYPLVLYKDGTTIVGE